MYAISGALLVAMAAAFMASSGGGGRGQNQPSQPGTTLVAKIGDYAIVEETLQARRDAAVQQQLQQNPDLGDALDAPESQLHFLGDALLVECRAGWNLEAAKQLGVEVSDEDIRAAKSNEAAAQILQVRQEFVQTGQLKSTATDADFDALFKSQMQATPDEFRTKFLAPVEQALASKDPAARAALAAGVAPDLTVKVLAQRAKPTDDQLKADAVSVVAKELLLTGASLSTNYQKVSDGLAKGDSFDALRAKYGSKPAKGDGTVTFTDAELYGAQAPLRDLKVGAVSRPLQDGPGVAFYQVVSRSNAPPKDFAAQRDTLAKGYAAASAAKQYAAAVDKLKSDPGSVVWSEPGWKALFDVQELRAASTLAKPPADQVKRLEAIASAAAAAADSGGTSLNKSAAELARFAVAQALAPHASKAVAAEANDDLVAALRGLSDTSPSVAVELELARALLAKKDGPGFSTALSTAAGEVVDPTPYSIGVWRQIAALQTAGAALLAPDAKASIEAASTSFAQGQAEQAKEHAAALKAQAAENAKDQAALAKAQRDAKAQAAKADKPPTAKKP